MKLLKIKRTYIQYNPVELKESNNVINRMRISQDSKLTLALAANCFAHQLCAMSMDVSVAEQNGTEVKLTHTIDSYI